ncbi:2,4-dienoyl-CoA reductase-like NADH-dependent reductase (Old Yellow Enzyme family) [Litorimonas taeanensis]|uniref:2,4-dienoyl-CoA reductase-like NADH-dependent reductase (Old Yellow Enzyme family) n=1 Tax=Litorimonas taeanensis TaxID=568099 RepID=A0A420WLE1_9PROT|nr:NADH:flavin oxidoreductase [Litorimonas taeanensis]RKQ71861.1 2,4-dienoyl-CoA reductase-like NADH-dependent reductase (Old Yellow Enzyme family) [Litorimonas taeanensis]
MSPLFKPFSLKSLDLPNRIVMAPMTRNFSPNGIPGANVAEYYRKRAAADVGLILSEGTTIDRPGASNDPRIPNFHTEEALAGWEKVISTVHEAGGKMGPQIWHTGMARKPGTGPHPEADSDSPSGLTHTGKQVMPAPTMEEISDIADSYARAAANAKRLGFDMVEIHGAHGYLVDEFFWDVMNQRDDKYGGTLVDRAEFAREVIGKCRKAIGEDMPLCIRVSQWKQQDYAARLAETPEALGEFLTSLTEAGADILHCSQRRFWEAEFEGSDLNFAGWAKKLTGATTISVGSVGLKGDFFGSFKGEGAEVASLDNLIERMERDEFDLIAVGRALIQDPTWAQKVKEGRLDALEPYDGAALMSLN